MSVMTSEAERFIWNNLRMYLLTYPTCLLDNVLGAKNNSDRPIERYDNLLARLDQHIGLGSYTNTQPTQFSRLPFITVNIAVISGDYCNTRVVLGFDIAFDTDTPDDKKGSYSVGNTNEAVASFRANILSSLDELMYDATDSPHYEEISFFDALREQTIPNPTTPEDMREWKYNIWGSVDSKVEISEISQLKREDRSSAISVFSVVYTMDLNRLKGNHIDCGC